MTVSSIAAWMVEALLAAGARRGGAQVERAAAGEANWNWTFDWLGWKGMRKRREKVRCKVYVRRRAGIWIGRIICGGLVGSVCMGVKDWRGRELTKSVSWALMMCRRNR
jgi:hypothetical protein